MKGEAIRTTEIASMKVLAAKKPPKNRPQDGVIFCMDRLEPDPCPRCNNRTLMALEDPNEVTKKNALIKKKNKHARDLYELNGCVGKKPSNKRFVDQTIACFSFKLNCRGSMNGKGCYLCEKNKGNTPMILDKHGGVDDYVCSCAICSSLCSEHFTRSKFTHVYNQCTFERLNGNTSLGE